MNIIELPNGPVFKKGQPDDTYKFRPAPAPNGEYPYRLNLTDIIADAGDDKMVFHMAGDTGHTFKAPTDLNIAMAGQFNNCATADEPQFLYHLGDIVYHHGEADRYERQFFKPFANYPGPIFAIPGNHDSDVNPESPFPYQTLDAFTRVFCDTVSRPVSFSGNSARKSMTQPNVYWTLKAPLANIIGLYSNIPKYGMITSEQREWFKAELIAADEERPDKALLICLHHAPYSADVNHASSLPMINFLEEVFEETGIRPDLVVSGHVHNYQRFQKTYPDGLTVPFIVAGGGGFEELNDLAILGDERYGFSHPLFEGVDLMAYYSQQHGFLKISIEKGIDGLVLTGQYFTTAKKTNHNDIPTTIITDQFTYHLARNLTAV
jgi:calcineurin-like phosphoesterase family protein